MISYEAVSVSMCVSMSMSTGRERVVAVNPMCLNDGSQQKKKMPLLL